MVFGRLGEWKEKKSLCCPFSHVVISFFNYVLPTAVLQLRNKAWVYTLEWARHLLCIVLSLIWPHHNLCATLALSVRYLPVPYKYELVESTSLAIYAAALRCRCKYSLAPRNVHLLVATEQWLLPAVLGVSFFNTFFVSSFYFGWHARCLNRPSCIWALASSLTSTICV